MMMTVMTTMDYYYYDYYYDIAAYTKTKGMKTNSLFL